MLDEPVSAMEITWCVTHTMSTELAKDFGVFLMRRGLHFFAKNPTSVCSSIMALFLISFRLSLILSSVFRVWLVSKLSASGPRGP